MKRVSCFVGVFFFLLGLVGFAKAQTPSTSTPDYGEQIQKLQDELNQLEIQNEMLQGQATSKTKGTKNVIGLSGGSFEQDFVSQNNSWGILQGQNIRLRLWANPMEQVKGHLAFTIH